MSDFVAFLGQRLDEVQRGVERFKHAAEESDHFWGAKAYGDPYCDAEDIADLVLREVEAKRRILELHMPRMGLCDTCAMATVPVYPTPCPTLAALVLPFRDHLDYDPAWAPEEART